MSLGTTIRSVIRSPSKLMDADRWKRRINPPPAQRDFDLSAGSASVEELQFLSELVRASASFPGPLIEIGTLFGRTTIEMALAKAPDQRLITVDLYSWNPWGLSPERHRQFTEHSLRFLTETGHVELVKADKNDFFERYDGPPPALVFLDADHSYEATKIDIEWAQSVGAGIIAGHDHSEKWSGVRDAVEECGGAAEIRGTLYVMAK